MFSQILAAAAFLLPLTSGLPAPASKNADVQAREAKSAHPFFVLQTNDDGWMDNNLLQLYYNLTGAGIKSVISATARDMSGIVTEAADVLKLWPDGCIYDSCPPYSPGHAGSKTDHAINEYVNAGAVTALKYGLHNLNPNYLGGKPHMVLSGPNQGKNVGLPAKSGTIAAARAAAQMEIPAIAFAGATDAAGPWNSTVPLSSKVYAELALNLTRTLLNTGAPHLPNGTFLSVNFSPVAEKACADASQFAFIMTRPCAPTKLWTTDMRLCKHNTLPQEFWAIEKSTGCWATVTLAKAEDGKTAGIMEQEFLHSKLGSILSCGYDGWYDGDFDIKPYTHRG